MKTHHLLALTSLLLLALATGSCSSAAPASPAPETTDQVDAAAPGEETYSNTIKWTTASEVDNFGYDVYRGDTSDGPFVRLTEEPVEGAGTSDEVNSYRFLDDTIDPNKTYYYYVESISMSGVREHFTPVGEAKPKIEQGSE